MKETKCKECEKAMWGLRCPKHSPRGELTAGEFDPTPPETPSWEPSLEFLIKNFIQSIQGTTTDWQERRLKEFLESEYKRGYAEAYEENSELFNK